MRSGSSHLLMVLCLFAFGALPSTLVAAPIQLTGKLEVFIGGCSNPEHGRPIYIYALEDEHKHTLTELSSSSIDFAKIKPRARIRVTGNYRQKQNTSSTSTVFEAAAVEPLPEEQPLTEEESAQEPITEATTIQNPSPAEAATALSCLLIFAKAPDSSSWDRQATVEDYLFSTTNTSVAQAMLVGTYDKYTISHGDTALVTVSTNASGSSWMTMSSDMRAAAEAAGYRLRSYDRILIYCPAGTDFGSSLAFAGGTSASFTEGSVASIDLPLHELGHTLGLQHAGTSSSEYGDTTCTMGFSHTNQRKTATFSAPRKFFLGSISSSNGTMATVSQDSYYDLYPVADNPATSPGMRLVRIEGTDHYASYLIERTPYAVLWESGWTNQVIVHDCPTSYSRRTKLTLGNNVTAGNATIQFEGYGPNMEFAVVNFLFNDGNDKPSATNQTIPIKQGKSKAITLSGTDPNSNPLNYSLLSNPASGNVSGTPPNITYTPNAGFSGSDSFQFRVHDGKLCSIGTITINIVANRQPIADSLVVTTNPSTAVGMTLTGSDPDDDNISFRITSNPSHGQLNASALPGVTYTPNAGFTGVDRFTFVVNDGTIDSAPATVFIGVNNTAPSSGAGADQTIQLVSSGTSQNPTAGFFYAFDAAQNAGGSAKWSSTSANTLDWNFASAQTAVDVVDPRFDRLTKAYAFPAAKSSRASLDALVNENTSCTWEFVLDTDSDNGLIFEAGGGTDGIQFYVESGAIKGHVRNGNATATVASTLTTEDKGRFIHVVYTINFTTKLFKLYLDGVEVDSKSWSGSDWCGSDDAGLGGVGGSASPTGLTTAFNGKIAMFRYYEAKAFTDAEVSTNFESLASGGEATTTLAGTANDANGDTLFYTWSVSQSPANGSVAFSDQTSLTSSVTFRVEGDYVLTLTVSDGVNASTSNVTIHVLPPTTSLVVTYFGNGNTGGTVPMDGTPYDLNDTVTVLGNTGNLVRDNATFAGWNTAADGSGTPYVAGNTFSITNDVSLHAQWNVTTYTVTYTAGSGGTITGEASQSVAHGGNATEVTAVPNTGYLFSGWSDGSAANPRTDTNLTSNLSVTANFELNQPPTANAGSDQPVVLVDVSIPWTPNPEDLAAWFDAKDPDTIVFETGSSTAVRQWSDKSGKGRHLTQTTTSAQPTLGVDEIQMPVNKYMLSGDGLMPSGSGGRHVFAVVNNTTTTNVGFISQAHGNWLARTGFAITGEPAVRYNGAMTYDGGVLSANDSLIAVSYNSGTNVSTMRFAVNGSQRVGTIVSGDGALASNATKLYVGCNHLGSLSPSQGAADFRELIILTDATLSTDTQQKLEGYLAHKWGLEDQLPSDPLHPYKAAAPTMGGTGANITLNGSVDDPNRTTPTATWSVVSTEPAGLSVEFTNSSSPVTEVKFTSLGTYTLRLTADDGIAAPVSDDVVIRVTDGSAVGYSGWSTGSFAKPFTDTAMTSNPDGDRRSNMLEFAFGTDPTITDMGPLATDGSKRGDPVAAKENGGGFALYYIRRADHGSTGSVIYSTHFSDDLTTFTPSSAGLEVVGSAGDGYELVKVPFPTGAKFGYVKIEAAP